MARAYYNEHDPKAAAWLRELIRRGLIAPGDVDERSISDVLPSDLDGYAQCHFFAGVGGWSLALRLAGWSDERPVWTGSCPCQPFSTAGEGEGFADERHLWPDFKWLIQQCRPPVVFGEQIAPKTGRAWLARVFTDLEGMGYRRAGADLCAASQGSPQMRQRLWWVGWLGFTVRLGRGCGYVRENKPASGLEQASPWSSVETIECNRGKRRRFEPSAFPLANGVPARVVRLRGYGNAIVPQVAAHFIQASEEAVSGHGFDLADLI